MSVSKEKNDYVADTTINALSLCSGVGQLDEGVALALEHFGLGHRTAAYAEWEGYPAQQLVSLMETGALAPAPVWCGDFADLDWKAFHGVVDAFIAGYPCQAWSSAGKRLGFADKRWVWGHIEHGLSIVRPRFVYLENVRGLISGGGLGATIAGLSRLGYDTEWSTLYASSVGANHQRDRVFIFGYMADAGGGRRGNARGREMEQPRRAKVISAGAVANGSGVRKQGRKPIQQRNADARRRGKGMAPERALADGLGIGRTSDTATQQQPDARLRGKGMVDADRKLHDAGARDGIQRGLASNAGDQMEHRKRKGNKPQSKSAREKGPGAGRSVDWSEELIFAPGQNDPRWNQIEHEGPHLLPTTQSDLHELADGVASILGARFIRDDEGRSGKLEGEDAAASAVDTFMIERERSLRCSGNGVVPMQAAVAYINLMRRAGIGQ